MLTIKADASPGTDLREEMIPELVELARRLQCRIELTANSTRFWVRPFDTVEEMKAAFDRLYLAGSSIIGVGITTPVPRER